MSILLALFFASSPVLASNLPYYQCTSKTWVVEIDTDERNLMGQVLYSVFKRGVPFPKRVELADIFGEIEYFSNVFSFRNHENKPQRQLELIVAKASENLWEGKLWFRGAEERITCKKLPRAAHKPAPVRRGSI